MKNGISIGNGILWVFYWFCFMLLYTVLDMFVWRKMPTFGSYLNLITMVLCIIVYLLLLIRDDDFKLNLSANISLKSILLALGCSVLFYFLLDKFLDPIFESFFPASEATYQETLKSLSKTPIISLIQVCILAPFIEEIIMRGFLLEGLKVNYSTRTALLVSSLLFALLHFNMVQTLSAFFCGIILGMLYLRTNSIFCCILAHVGYNLISYVTAVMPLYNK